MSSIGPSSGKLAPEQLGGVFAIYLEPIFVLLSERPGHKFSIRKVKSSLSTCGQLGHVLRSKLSDGLGVSSH